MIYLPYQTAPILTAVLLGGVHHGRAVRMCLAYSAVYLVVIAPLGFLWWRWLGMFGPGELNENPVTETRPSPARADAWVSGSAAAGGVSGVPPA